MSGRIVMKSRHPLRVITYCPSYFLMNPRNRRRSVLLFRGFRLDNQPTTLFHHVER